MISYSYFIFEFNFYNKKFAIKLKVKLLFKLIRLNIQLYPPKKKKKRKRRKTLKDLKVLEGEMKNIIKLIRRIKIVELYSNIHFSHVNPYVTVYINALINGIYGNIINVCECEKIYLNITSKYTENNIEGSVIIHTKFRPSTLFKSIPILIRMMKIKSKEGDKIDGDKFNTKHYGDNSWDYKKLHRL